MSEQEQFEQMMLSLQSPDNELRTCAEATYKHTKETNGMWLFQALLELAASSSNEVAVQLSLVELRKILRHKAFTFQGFSQDAIKHVQQRQLHLMANAAEPKIRLQAAECVADTAAKLHEDNGPGWADLWPLLMQTMANATAPVGARAACCAVFTEVSGEVAKAALSSEHRTLAGAFTNCITSTDTGLSLTAVQSLSHWMGAVPSEQDTKHYATCVPPILQSLAQSLNEAKYDAAKDLALYLCDLVEHAPLMFRNHAANLLQGMMQVASTMGVVAETRHMAVEVMLTYCETEPKTIRKIHGFAKALFDLLFNYLMNPEYEDNWENSEDKSEEDDLEKTTDFDIGATGMDRWASSLKAKHVQQIAASAIATNIQSQDWKQRNAALTAITYIVEACSAEFLPQLPTILNYVLPTLKDECVYIRYSAILCLAQSCSDFAPKFQHQYHATVLPAMTESLKDVPRIQVIAAGAINTFFDEAGHDDEVIDDELALSFGQNYAGHLFNALIPLMNSTPHTFVKKECCEALGSIAEFCKKNISQHVDVLVPEFQKILALDETQFQNQDEIIELKCIALQSVTLLAAAVGMDGFGKYTTQVCDFLVNLLNVKYPASDPRTKYVIRAWTCMAECMKEHIAPYLQAVMPRLIAISGTQCDYEFIADEPGKEVPEPADGVMHARINHPEKGDVVVKLKTAEVEEKSLGLSVLRVIMEELEDTHVVLPYVEEVSRVGMECLAFKTLEEVRVAACILLRNVVKLYKKFRTEALPQVINHVIPQLLQFIVDEPSVEVVTELVWVFNELLNAGTPGTLAPQHTEKISEVLLSIITSSLKRRNEVVEDRQKTEQDDEEVHDALDEEDSVEENLLLHCCDMAGAMLCNVPSFVPLFISKYLQTVQLILVPTMGDAEQKTGLSLLCYFVKCGAPEVLPMLNDITTPFFTYIGHEDPELVQAAFYGLGLALEYGAKNSTGFDVAGFATALYQRVGAFYQSSKAADEEWEATRINVAHVAVKLLENTPQACEPAALWQAVVQSLPGAGDEEEAEAIHEKLTQWIASSNPLVADPALRQQLLQKLKAVHPTCIKKETRNLLQTLN